MSSLIDVVRKMYSRPVEMFNDIVVRPKLKNGQVLERFGELSAKYSEAFSLFSGINTL